MIVVRDLKDGVSIDAALQTPYPSLLSVVQNASRAEARGYDHSYGYVLYGRATITAGDSVFALSSGGYFSVPGLFHVDAEFGTVILITRLGYRGLLQAGEIEHIGRLSYIDGCSDTLLVSPPRMGDPCFNYLHFPKGINQTQHTHPSVRFGVVARGSGVAYQTKDRTHDGWEEELSRGCVFLLHAQELHSFRTTDSQEIMDVIAFHPDSDWGPTDAAHPMLNRTYIGNAKSALVSSSIGA